jgi:GPH family glycoside/pentoside/hexuronide:cation symporter
MFKKKEKNQEKKIEFFNKVPFSQKAYLGISMAGATFVASMIDSSTLKFYTDFILLPAILFGVAQLIFGIWNAINDPIIGYYLDKRIPLAGKRKWVPWMWKSIPLLLFGYFIIIFVSPLWDDMIIFFILLAGLFIFDTGYAFFGINRSALMVSITNEDNERASMVVVSLIFQTILGIFSFILPVLFLTGETPFITVLIMLSIVGVISAIFLILGVRGIWEPLIVYNKKKKINLKKVIIEMFKSKTFVYYILYTFLMNGVASTQLTFMLYFIEDVTQTSGILATLATSLILPIVFISYFLTSFISKKMGVRKSLLLFLALNSIGFFGLLFITDLWLMVLFYIFITSGATAHWILSLPLIGNIIDEYELKTRKRNEGLFFGISAIFVSPSKSIIIFIFTLIITMFGYVGGASSQTPEAIIGIRLGSALIPLIFVLLSFIVIFFYPLRGEKLEIMKEEIRILYEKKLKNSFDISDSEYNEL